MNNIVDYDLREAYLSMKGLDKLKDFVPIINLETFGSMSKKLYMNDADTSPFDESQGNDLHLKMSSPLIHGIQGKISQRC